MSEMDKTPVSNDLLEWLRAIGASHRRLKCFAVYLRSLANVRMVTHVAEMPDLTDAYRLEQYVDAELDSGEALSWCLEITVSQRCIAVEADVRRVQSGGQDVVLSIGEFVYSTPAACSAALPAIADRLCGAIPSEVMT